MCHLLPVYLEGTLYAVNTNILQLSLPSNTNPHQQSYLSSTRLRILLIRVPVIPIILPPGLVYFVIGAINDDDTKLQYCPSFN